MMGLFFYRLLRSSSSSFIFREDLDRLCKKQGPASVPPAYSAVQRKIWLKRNLRIHRHSHSGWPWVSLKQIASAVAFALSAA